MFWHLKDVDLVSFGCRLTDIFDSDISLMRRKLFSSLLLCKQGRNTQKVFASRARQFKVQFNDFFFSFMFEVLCWKENFKSRVADK